MSSNYRTRISYSDLYFQFTLSKGGLAGLSPEKRDGGGGGGG